MYLIPNWMCKTEGACMLLFCKPLLEAVSGCLAFLQNLLVHFIGHITHTIRSRTNTFSLQKAYKYLIYDEMAVVLVSLFSTLLVLSGSLKTKPPAIF